MKKILLISSFLISSLNLFGQQDSISPTQLDSISIAQDSLIVLDSLYQVFQKLELKTKIDSVSYALGMSLRTNRAVKNADLMMVMKGFYDANFDTTRLVNRYFLNNHLRELRRQRRNNRNKVNKTVPSSAPTLPESKIAELKQLHKATIEKNEAFFKKNSQKEGIITTESGLQYEILIPSKKGAKPTFNNRVEIHYVCTDIDGKELDRSNGLVNFALPQLLKGWQEGLLLLPVGATYRFYLPTELAFDYKGAKNIEPFQALIYTMELIKIK